METTTRRLHKEKLITVNRKKRKFHKDQKNNNNEKTKMGRKTTVWIFKETNEENFT